MKTFALYGTSACHLCELAAEMIERHRPGAGMFVVEEVDISGSDELFERYGIRIPVLRHPDGRELDWPFSADELGDFLAS